MFSQILHSKLLKTGLITLVIGLSSLILIIGLKISAVYSQTCAETADDTSAVIQGGLVTAFSLGNTLQLLNPNSSSCYYGKSSAITNISTIQDYNTLKSLYFTQIKSADINQYTFPNVPGIAELNSQIQAGKINLFNTPTGPVTLTLDGSLNINNPNTVVIIFADSGIDITTNQLYNLGSSGLMLVSNGNINVYYEAGHQVTEVDAFMITYGQFCSIYQSGHCGNGSGGQVDVGADQLIVHGSVISANSGAAPLFLRKLADNQDPAEKFIYEPKYLIISKPVFAKDKAIWGEIK
ncbi:hypothetical protein M1563_00495 [Patescibacteria group bacterium]|nr:hypothetical protein [Patescibacteria group bacterium]MCL5409280.1 hypothetical protein [Patescibacteria group bacterium]